MEKAMNDLMMTKGTICGIFNNGFTFNTLKKYKIMWWWKCYSLDYNPTDIFGIGRYIVIMVKLEIFFALNRYL